MSVLPSETALHCETRLTLCGTAHQTLIIAISFARSGRSGISFELREKSGQIRE